MVTLTLRNNPQELDKLTHAFVAFAEAQGFAAKFSHDVNLALEEVVANVAFYAWQDDLQHEFQVRLEMQGCTLVATVEDDGEPFNPLDTPPPDLDVPMEERKVGGLGIFLAKHYMDDLSYERRDGRNVLTMKKGPP